MEVSNYLSNAEKYVYLERCDVSAKTLFEDLQKHIDLLLVTGQSSPRLVLILGFQEEETLKTEIC